MVTPEGLPLPCSVPPAAFSALRGHHRVGVLLGAQSQLAPPGPGSRPLLRSRGVLAPLPGVSGEGPTFIQTALWWVSSDAVPSAAKLPPSDGAHVCGGGARGGGARGTLARARRRPLVSCVAVPVVKPAVLPGTKALSAASAQAAAAQKNKLKEPGGGSFRYGARGLRRAG